MNYTDDTNDECRFLGEMILRRIFSAAHWYFLSAVVFRKPSDKLFSVTAILRFVHILKPNQSLLHKLSQHQRQGVFVCCYNRLLLSLVIKNKTSIPEFLIKLYLYCLFIRYISCQMLLTSWEAIANESREVFETQCCFWINLSKQIFQPSGNDYRRCKINK